MFSLLVSPLLRSSRSRLLEGSSSSRQAPPPPKAIPVVGLAILPAVLATSVVRVRVKVQAVASPVSRPSPV